MTPTIASPCGRLRLYHADNLGVLEALPSRAIDAIVTDPPYGISDDEKLAAAGPSGNHLSTMSHEWDRELPLAWIEQADRVMKPGAAMICWSDKALIHSVLKPEMEKHGIYFLHDLFWNRTQPSCNPRKNFGNEVEAAFFGRKAGTVLCWTGGDHRGNLIRCPKVMPNERVHPTQKPLRVMEWCLQPISAPGHVVLDPFMGSGTTGVVAIRMGRSFIGIERDPAYFEAAAERLQAELEQGKLFGAEAVAR